MDFILVSVQLHREEEVRLVVEVQVVYRLEGEEVVDRLELEEVPEV